MADQPKVPSLTFYPRLAPSKREPRTFKGEAFALGYTFAFLALITIQPIIDLK